MKIIPIPCLHDNYAYLVFDQAGAEAAVIDPSEAWPIIREIESRGLYLTAVLCTHHHHDHVGGLDDLLVEFPGLNVLGLREERSRITHLNWLLEDEEEFTVSGFSARLLHTPGHTSSGVAYSLEDNLFTGDTLFGAGCGRLFEGTPEQMVHSLEKIVACGPDTKLYFGHEYTMLNLRFAVMIEPDNQAIRQRMHQVEELRAEGDPSVPSTVGEELQTNPFLRCGEPAVISYVEKHCGIKDNRPVPVFAALRELRNNFA